jgi:hypothetical protein
MATASQIRVNVSSSSVMPEMIGSSRTDVAKDKKELDRLANMKISHSKMYKAIMYIRWQQFKRVWWNSRTKDNR